MAWSDSVDGHHQNTQSVSTDESRRNDGVLVHRPETADHKHRAAGEEHYGDHGCDESLCIVTAIGLTLSRANPHARVYRAWISRGAGWRRRHRRVGPLRFSPLRSRHVRNETLPVHDLLNLLGKSASIQYETVELYQPCHRVVG